MLGDENFFYRGEDGFYGSIEKDGGGTTFSLPSTTRRTASGPPNSGSATERRCMVDRIEVVNTETGEVLMDDWRSARPTARNSKSIENGGPGIPGPLFVL